MVCHWKIYQTVLAVGFEVGWGVGVQGWGGGRSGLVVLIDNGRVYQSKAADALVQVKTTTFGTNVGLNMLLNISSRYLGGLFWSMQLRGLPSSDGYFYYMAGIHCWGNLSFGLFLMHVLIYHPPQCLEFGAAHFIGYLVWFGTLLISHNMFLVLWIISYLTRVITSELHQQMPDISMIFKRQIIYQ